MKKIQFMKKIKELERANSILKEALGFISKSQKKYHFTSRSFLCRSSIFGQKLQEENN